MASDLFDMKLRAMRRDRAARMGAELFLHERAFEDCLDRLAMVQRSFERALLLGCPDPRWAEALRRKIAHVDAADPGGLFAQASRGSQLAEDRWTPAAANYDLCIAIGTLDTVNQLPNALLALRHTLKPDGLLIGAMAGGETLPKLRAAMRAADEVRGQASAHVHPRIEPSALAGLLGGAGFSMPVVDVDRVPVSYSTLARLVRDLRAMGATNILSQRSRKPLLKAEVAAASAAFCPSQAQRTVETFEILHFAAWTPARPQQG